MDSHLFRRGRWVIDVNDGDASGHLRDVGFTPDTVLIMKYFIHLLYAASSTLGLNEFAERHDEIKDAIIEVMRQKLGAAAQQLSALIEGIVKKSLVNDGCIIDAKPHPKWTGAFHEYSEPKNFHQLLEGALRDPRSRIGRTIDYPPSEEIFHVSEMIRNPLAHGAVSAGMIEDYKVLFFLIILLFHDIVNPHAYPGNHKYLKWIERTRIDLRLSGDAPTDQKIEKLAADAGLDVNEVRKNLT